MDDPVRTQRELDELAQESVATVRRWLEASRDSTAVPAAARRLAGVLGDPRGLEFTVGFVDQVVRTEDARAAAGALARLGRLSPATLSFLDRAQILAGSRLARALPAVVVPTARARVRQMVGHMVVDARDEPFGRAVASMTAGGNRLNVNLLGEAVLGEEQALKHLGDTRRLLSRPDVDYVSIKVSSICSQVSMWGFEQTVETVVERLLPLYLEAAKAPAGSKFINLDMEEYRDLRLTLEVFQRLLSHPGTRGLEAGIVLQAYLPDALGAMQELVAFADRRVDSGGAGIKVRLVKGANLSMERVHAELAGWPLATCTSKQATDANYKLVLHWLLRPEHMRGLRIGVAGHNLFDIAFAHLLGERRGVAARMEFEMLQGMATAQAEAVRADVGDLLLYVPAVRPEEFDVAISYLVRRLEENAAQENFMSGIFGIEADNAVFERERRRFEASVEDLAAILASRGHQPPPPAHQQDRGAHELPAPVEGDLPGFANEPDTNPALPANQDWARRAIRTATEPGWLQQQPLPRRLELHEVDELVRTAREGAARWAARPAIERARVLYRAADLLAQRRGLLVQLAAAEAGKSVQQSDPEVSEAIDFARYYAHRALELGRVRGARFEPDRLVLVTPPWNFPIAIPAGSTLAALAAGAAVVHKPSSPTPHCSMAVLEALWDAGVPREVLHGVLPDEGEVGRALVCHPGVDRVVLTGASETAAMFSSWRPGLAINAETSGKNAVIVTPSADRDLAVADLVASAFGHAGQKCSAASLAILVGSVHRSARFRRQLVDAAASLVVDWPSNLAATVGPLTEQPSDKLRRALTSLEPGESWLLEPRQLDDTGRLWSPGIKDGVHPGSFFHRTEVFGPVLGLVAARDLDEALEIQNGTDFGLTGGIHSLDADEVRHWLDRVEVGNAYVNRGITGAIVQRQSFGGWKKSSVGLGSKAGGPDYLMLFGTWHDDPLDPPGGTPDPLAGRLARALGLSHDEAAWLQAARADDERTWREDLGRPRDESGLECEANLLRHRGADVLLRVGAGTPAPELARVLLAARRSGARVRIAWHPRAREELDAVQEVLDEVLAGTEQLVADDGELAELLASGGLDVGVGIRVRVLGELPQAVVVAVCERPEVALLDDPVTSSGRVELRLWLREQAISITLHRFGNPSAPMLALADELRGHGLRRPTQ